MSDDLIITNDICPHGISSSLCELCTMRGQIHFLQLSITQLRKELKEEKSKNEELRDHIRQLSAEL